MREEKFFRLLPLIVICCLIITGCASSAVQRDAAANVDLGVQNAKNLVDGASDGSVADSYQNSSQTAKGMVYGGIAGATVGSLAPGVGFFAGTAVGAVMGGSYGTYIDSNATLEDQLQNRGANIVILGDQILLVMPSVRIFQSMTADIKPQAYGTINLIAKFVNQYTKTLVKVSVYTDNTGSRSADVGLSQEEANAASQNVNRRMVWMLVYCMPQATVEHIWYRKAEHGMLAAIIVSKSR